VKIIAPDALAFGVDDLDACYRYLTDYGLKKVDSAPSGARFEALDGTAAVVRRASAAGLPPPICAAPGPVHAPGRHAGAPRAVPDQGAQARTAAFHLPRRRPERHAQGRLKLRKKGLQVILGPGAPYPRLDCDMDLHDDSWKPRYIVASPQTLQTYLFQFAEKWAPGDQKH
jgi:hypothetical protein